MKSVTIVRDGGDDQGTPGGTLLVGGKFFCHTLELPWRDNLRQRSCIPVGFYQCRMVRSPRFGPVYHITNVPGRSHVLIHSGTWAGNIDKGWKSHVEGCVLLGEKTGIIEGQRAVLVSRPAVSRFMAAMERQPFTLEIRNG